MISRKKFSIRNTALLVLKTIAVLIGASISLLFILTLPVVLSTMYNESFLAILNFQTKKYSHPSDSKLVQRFTMVGNFAPASNQCGFIVAEVRTSKHDTDSIREVYKPILFTSFNEANPPYHVVNLYSLKNEEDVTNLERIYPEVYERVTPRAMNNTHAYLLITAKTGYPTNYDLRCH